MSLDVFRRHFGKATATASRGPPGLGFKVTTDGGYDIDGKRICNVAKAVGEQGAVNLKLARHILQNEVRLVYTVTSRLRSSIDDLNISMQNIEGRINERLKKIESRKDFIVQEAKFIQE